VISSPAKARSVLLRAAQIVKLQDAVPGPEIVFRFKLQELAVPETTIAGNAQAIVDEDASRLLITPGLPVAVEMHAVTTEARQQGAAFRILGNVRADRKAVEKAQAPGHIQRLDGCLLPAMPRQAGNRSDIEITAGSSRMAL
jgi:hypothetical protein